MKEFMFIYKGGDHEWMEKATPEEHQATMAKWGAWMEELGKKGQLATGGSPLPYNGKRVTKDGVITDISAAEYKELVSGYSIVKAKDYDEAAKLAKDCPIFQHPGTTLEVREIVQM